MSRELWVGLDHPYHVHTSKEIRMITLYKINTHEIGKVIEVSSSN